MAISIVFRVNKNDELLFDDVVSAIFKARDLFDEKNTPISVERGVKYSRSDDFKWVTVQKVDNSD